MGCNNCNNGCGSWIIILIIILILCVFNQLEKADIEEIARRMLKTLTKRVKDMDIDISFTDSAVSALADEGFDKV